MEAARRLFLVQASRLDLLTYAKVINPEFQTPKHIKQIAEKLQQVYDGKIKRLIINEPPRHGKSWLASKLFPSWFLGNRPSSQIIITSYADTLAIDFTRWIRNIVQDPLYQRVFDVQLKDDIKAANRWETVQGGVGVGAGVGGAITGRGADLAIIDDPVKNWEEAMSTTIQEKIWDWYCSTLRTRLHPNAAIVIIQTRWGEDDLTGKLLMHEPGIWDVLTLPAVDENNQPLWPERYSLEELMSIKSGTTLKIWEALYQQNPIDVTERIFPDIKYIDVPDDLVLVAYLDPAFGGEDSNALTIGGFSGGKYYVAAGYAWYGQIDKTYDRVEFYCKGYNVRVLNIEYNAAQVAVGYEMEKRGLVVRGVQQYKNKHFRIVHYAKKNWNSIYFNNGLLVDPDTREYVTQIVKYSEYAKRNDAPDSLGGFIQAMKRAA